MPQKVRVWFRQQRKAWYGEFWQGPKRIVKSFGRGAQAKRNAHLWKSHMEVQLNKEDWMQTQSIPWGEVTALYIQSKRANKKADKTIVEIENSLGKFEELIGAVPSDQIRQHHIEQFKLKRGQDVSNRSVNKDLEVLRAFTNWGTKANYIKANLEFEMLPTVQRKFLPPSKEKITDLFTYAKEYPPLYMRMVLAVALGWRRGAIEKLSLVPTDDYYVDLDSGHIRSLEQKTRQEVVKPLSPLIVRKLEWYLQHVPDGSKLWFPDRWDGRTREVWESVRSKAGLPKFTFHNLRNLSVSYLSQQGESSAVLQNHLGHKNIKTTERYLGVDDETAKRIATKFDDLFGEILS